MSQRQLLENSLSLANTMRGPAKVFYAPLTLPAPTRLEQIVDPTGGAPATGWSAFGSTRGGINVVKRVDENELSDIDQITGTYDVVVTNRRYQITTQLAEILDRTQFGVAMEMGVASQVSTTGPTQILTPFDTGSNDPAERRLAVVFPKGTDGKAMAFFFRRVSLTGGDKTLRFDRNDPVSPPLEFIAMPEIATSISADQEWGYQLEII